MRTKRSLLNFGSGTINNMVVLAVGFISTPFILRWLGEERYGAFRAASDWFAYLALLELGVGGALLALLAKAAGKSDDQRLRATLVTGMWWYLRIVFVMVAAGLVLVITIPQLVPVRPELRPDLQRGVLIALVALLFIPFGYPFKGLMESQQRGYWIHALLLLQSLTITVTAVATAWAGWGITGQFLAVLLGALIFNLPLIFQGIRRFPGAIRDAFGRSPDREIHRELRSLNTPTLLYNMAGRFSFDTDNIIVALLLGPAAVVPLFITQKLITLAQGQLMGVGNASWAALAELHFQGQSVLFNRRLVQLTGVVTVFGVAALVPIAAYNKVFVTLWVGIEQYGGVWVGIVAAVNAFLRSVVALWGWCFGGTARTPLLVKASVTETVINVGLSVVLTFQFGLIGPLLGTAISISLVSVWYHPVLLHRVFGTSLKDLSQAVVFPLILAVPYAVPVYWVARTYPPGGWLELALHMGLASLAYLALWWLLMMRPADRAQVLDRVGGLLPMRAS